LTRKTELVIFLTPRIVSGGVSLEENKSLPLCHDHSSSHISPEVLSFLRRKLARILKFCRLN